MEESEGLLKQRRDRMRDGGGVFVERDKWVGFSFCICGWEAMCVVYPRDSSVATSRLPGKEKGKPVLCFFPPLLFSF